MKRSLAIFVLFAACSSTLLKGTSDSAAANRRSRLGARRLRRRAHRYLQLLDSPNARRRARVHRAANRRAVPHDRGDARRRAAAVLAGRTAFHLRDRHGEPPRHPSRRDRRTPTQDVAALRGWSAAFSPDGAKLAYLKIPDTSGADRGAEGGGRRRGRGSHGEARGADRAAQRRQRIAAARFARSRSGRETESTTGAIAQTSLLRRRERSDRVRRPPEPTARAQIYSRPSRTRPATPLTTDATDKRSRRSTRRARRCSSRTRARRAADAVAAEAGGAGGAGRRAPAGGAAGAGAAQAAARRSVRRAVDRRRQGRDDHRHCAVVLRRRPVARLRRPRGDENAVMTAAGRRSGATPRSSARARARRRPCLSPDGSRVAFQMMPRDDWEIFTVNRDGTGETRVTREIQHDLLPQFLDADRAPRRDRRGAPSPLVSLRPRRRRRARASSTTTPCARSRPSTRGRRAPTARSC